MLETELLPVAAGAQRQARDRLDGRQTRLDDIAGIAGDQCVLATANDALLRRYEVVIPRDAIACATAARDKAVLRHFSGVMDLSTPTSARVQWNGNTSQH